MKCPFFKKKLKIFELAPFAAMSCYCYRNQAYLRIRLFMPGDKGSGLINIPK